MDFKIWEATILEWVNSMKSGSPIKKINQLTDSVLTDIIMKFKLDFQNPLDFLNATFPNLLVTESLQMTSCNDYLQAATCLLIYVSFSKRAELEELREKMCRVLDNSAQLKITEFLSSIGNCKDVFQLSLSAINKVIYNINNIHCSHTAVIGDCLKTPLKHNISSQSCDSPLQGFFQTPQKNEQSKVIKCLPTTYGDGDYMKQIKHLTDQLVEEESEKSALQEQLLKSTLTCNELETKLRHKIEEIKNLRCDWESESRKNEKEVYALKDKINKKYEDEKLLKSELSHLRCFISSLESDLTNSASEKATLEHQLKSALDRCTKYEEQLRECTKLNIHLQEVIENKEKDLVYLNENIYKDEKSVNMSLTDSSFDSSVCVPENMGVIIDKLLQEKIIENTQLKETIEQLGNEKNNLMQKIENINKDLKAKDATNCELQFLNKELHIKIEKLSISEKELFDVQNELMNANAEIKKLISENIQLKEKCNDMNTRLSEKEHTITQYKNSKMLLHFDLLKLAEDLKSVQQRLQFEVNNITKLVDTKDNHLGESENNDISDFKIKINDKTCISGALNLIPAAGDNKLEKLQELFNYFENNDISWHESKISIQNACAQLNDSIITLKLKVNHLENNQKNSVKEKNKLELCLKNAEHRINEIEDLYSFEVKKLKKDIEEKESKILKLESLMNDFKESQKNLSPEGNSTKVLACANCMYEGGDFTKTSLSRKPGNIKIKKLSLQEEKEELNDSLEEVPVCNKTFDIVNIEDKTISDKTFSVKKDVYSNSAEKDKCSFWFVSPPPKAPPKITKREQRPVRGESWIISLDPVKEKPERIRKVSSVNDLTTVESCSNLTKSTSLSSIAEINSPRSKIETKSSGGTSFFSLTDFDNILSKKDEHATALRKAYSSEINLRNQFKSSEESHKQDFRLKERHKDPLAEIFRKDVWECDQNKKLEWDRKFSQMRKEILGLSNECERLRSALLESEQKRKKEKENFESSKDTIAQNITFKYENQLEHLKSEMKQLYNREWAKHKSDQCKLNSELQEQNKRYKEHMDQLRNQLWHIREKLLQEQKQKRDLERIHCDLKKKFENIVHGQAVLRLQEGVHSKDTCSGGEKDRVAAIRQLPNATFPTIPTEDEDEIFDNRFLDDMKQGLYPAEAPEDRLMELQNRNTLCLPHLKSSYPAETQFHNPLLFKESDLQFGHLHFTQESQSLTDSDHSMTRSLLPENKGKKKEQTSYKRPGPPTPSKHGRPSLQGGDSKMTPRTALRDINERNERSKGTPNRLKTTLSIKSLKRESTGGRDENSAPVTPRKKLGKIFRKPFGARDH